MIKARVFSTDGKYATISEIKEYKTEFEFLDAVELTSLYDDGASHNLIEIDSAILFKEHIKILKRDNPNHSEFGRKVHSLVQEVLNYENSKYEGSEENRRMKEQDRLYQEYLEHQADGQISILKDQGEL